MRAKLNILIAYFSIIISQIVARKDIPPQHCWTIDKSQDFNDHCGGGKSL